MAWGGISFRHRTYLIIIDCALTAQRYINEVLRPAVAPFFAIHREITQCLQDNVRPHSARLRTAFLRQQGINLLFIPLPFEHM